MSFLVNIVSVLTADIRTTLISLVIGFVVYKLAKFYVRVYNLPPGPIPLPIIGNLLSFRGIKHHWTAELERVADEYGPVFTIWVGGHPLVMISDIDIALEEFRKNNFAGRPVSVFALLFSEGDETDIAQTDYGHKWEALRRVAHSAAQKYSTSDKLVYVVSDCVDTTIETMIDKEGFNKPFVPFDYIFNMFLNIQATSAFGRRYDLNDPEYKSFKYCLRGVFHEMNQRFLFWEMFPILRKIDGKAFGKIKRTFDENIELMKNKFRSHYEDYDESVVRDFCDTLISAKNDALREGKESAPYLDDGHLGRAIFDMFFGGTDTTQSVFTWVLFFLCYYPDLQKKMKQEIETQIGDRIPTHEDRNRCHYIMAFISEVSRLRNIVPTSAPHKAVVTSKIGDHTIPEGTQITVFQGHILHNEKYWNKAEEFRPERFLENGKYVTTRPKAFIPFGVGRRVCIGERLAIADLFLVLVRFLQKTSDYELVLHYSGNTDPDPNYMIDIRTNEFKISFKK